MLESDLGVSVVHYLQMCILLPLLTLNAHAHSEGYCSWFVCMYVCICSLYFATSYIGVTKERYQKINYNMEMILNLGDLAKNPSFKGMVL